MQKKLPVLKSCQNCWQKHLQKLPLLLLQTPGPNFLALPRITKEVFVAQKIRPQVVTETSRDVDNVSSKGTHFTTTSIFQKFRSFRFTCSMPCCRPASPTQNFFPPTGGLQKKDENCHFSQTTTKNVTNNPETLPM